jgi:hypothetical protein
MGLDPAHIPSFEEWMRIETRTGWKFYANGVFMDVNFTRESTLTDPSKPGAYILSFDVSTEVEHFRGYAESKDRLRWKEIVPGVLPTLAKIRADKEAALRAKGIAIDESYQDPPVPKF